MNKLDIVINCLGMPFDGNTLRTASLGGSESAAYFFSRELVKAGHRVTLFTAAVEPEPVVDGVRYISAGQVSKASPLGANFHFYAENTPHDITIIQRHPMAFRFNFNSRMKYWWLHDLALKRSYADVSAMQWNIDGVMCVSDYHAAQVKDVYGFKEDATVVVRNGVDLEMVNNSEPETVLGSTGGLKLLYISRPERGLENLVKPGGILSQLGDKHDLYVCTYNNVTEQMAPYYENLWREIERRANLHNLGFLTKPKLYSFMKSMDLLVYPTPSETFAEFREVSCIAALEAQACGLPMLTTKKGSLPETCKDSGTLFSSIPQFSKTIDKLSNNPEKLADLKTKQLARFNSIGWDKSVEMFVEDVKERALSGFSVNNYLRDRIKHSAISDIVDLEKSESIEDCVKQAPFNLLINCADESPIREAIKEELTSCYKFAPLDSYAEHYANYYEYEKNRGVNYGPEIMRGNTRFEEVASLIAGLKEGTRVLDYGCAHGHYTINLAQRFPFLNFVGVDISESNVIKARKWALDAGVENVSFVRGEVNIDEGCIIEYKTYVATEETPTEDSAEEDVRVEVSNHSGIYGAVIAAEVLEHVRSPVKLINTLLKRHISTGGLVTITTPYGPWEAQGYLQHWPFRAHIHDFTREKINAIYGSLTNYLIKCVPGGVGVGSESMGSFVYSFNFNGEEYPEEKGMLPPYLGDVINGTALKETLKGYGAKQTLCLCMILKDDWQNLSRLLKSLSGGLLNEVVVAIDEKGTEQEICQQLLVTFAEQEKIPLSLIKSASPLEIGFDAARNIALEAVSSDWVLWLDADEVLADQGNLIKHLRNNLVDAYTFPQHHFSILPASIIKTDHPTKLFRNNLGIKFFGVVHEHPEQGMNEGIGTVQHLPSPVIAHYGYSDEEKRRGRFSRNFELLKRDRELNPGRKLNSFFWLRDMAQTAKWLLEQGAPRDEEFERIIVSGFLAWDEILEKADLRVMVESLPFFNDLVSLSGRKAIGTTLSVGLVTDVCEQGLEVDIVARSKDELLNIINAVLKVKVGDMPSDVNLIRDWDYQYQRKDKPKRKKG